MRPVPIVPLALVRELAPLASSHLILPQYWDDEEHGEDYRETYKFLRNRGDHVVLDNGVAEGLDSEQTLSNVLAIADELRPTEVVAPDVIGNPEETVQRSLQFLESPEYVELLAKHNTSAMIVLQLRDDNPWREQIDYQLQRYSQNVNAQAYISAFGLSKFLPVSRLAVAMYLTQVIPNLWGGQVPAFHLLGVGDSIEEVVAIDQSEFQKASNAIRSNDTAMPFWFAAADLPFDITAERSDFTEARGENFKPELDTHIIWYNEADRRGLARQNMIDYMKLVLGV